MRLSRHTAPPYWVRLTRERLTRRQRHDWILVLSAAGIPWQFCHWRHLDSIYVPALLEQKARSEIEAYEKENRPAPGRDFRWPLHRSWPFAPLYLLPLVIWHGMAAGWWSAPSWLPDHTSWLKLGSLDATRIAFHGEWLRAVTALALHSGIVHLTGNLVFGSFFLCLLARLCGTGHAWLLAWLGGVLGNCLSVIAHKPGYVSVGFSTAIFAAVGALAGVALWRASDRGFTPLAAALAFLAMLGVEGASTDYGAHICGLGAGSILGLLEGYALRRNWPLLPQALAAALSLLLPILAWYCTLRSGLHNIS